MATDRDTTRIVVERAGSYEQLRPTATTTPPPGPEEVRIDVRAAGVNYADVVVRMGLYASAKELVGWPITPGFEVAGVVESVGAAVTDLSPGDRVFAVSLFGGYSSCVNVARWQVFALPDDIDFEAGAGVLAVFLTAYFALCFLAHPRRGDHLLVHSAAGGVGGSLVQLGKLLGCEVTGVVGASHKVPVARGHGCDHVIDRSCQDLWAVAERLSPSGFDVVLDANGVGTLRKSYEHLRRPGKLVVYGFANMMPRGRGKPSYGKLAVDYLRTPRFNPLEMTNDSRSVMAFNLSYLFDRQDILRDAMDELLGWLRAGDIRPPAVTTYPLSDVARAHRDLESGQTTGKLVLLP